MGWWLSENSFYLPGKSDIIPADRVYRQGKFDVLAAGQGFSSLKASTGILVSKVGSTLSDILENGV